MNTRAGYYVTQPSGYKSYKPSKLPPNPEIIYDAEMMRLLSEADRKLGRLDGVTQILPNPELFVAMYVRKEAVLSSQIEGTQASLSDLLEIGEYSEKSVDIGEIVNYISALRYGLERIQEFPLSLRLLREIHEKLLSTGRGSERSPGEFRNSQNWIGPKGCTLHNATFVPPSVQDMKEALGDLEMFFYDNSDIPLLVKIAIIHAQFETIHPFLDGNGRMGRLLITFLLCQKQILSQPLLYLSYYFKKNRGEYYDSLMTVREKGDWESWIKFFLQGVAEVSDEATNTAKDILGLKTFYEEKLRELNNLHSTRLFEYLFEEPYTNKNRVKKYLNVSYPTAGKIVDEFCEMGILRDNTPRQQRNKAYIFAEYLKILNRGTEL